MVSVIYGMLEVISLVYYKRLEFEHVSLDESQLELVMFARAKLRCFFFFYLDVVLIKISPKTYLTHYIINYV